MTYIEKYETITNEICRRIKPGKKQLQKLFYLIERKGVDLGLNYTIHFYGPYSSKLDAALHTLESKGTVVIDTSGTTHYIKAGAGEIDKKLTCEENKVKEFVFDKFILKTSLELEAITTLDYAANKLLEPGYTDEDVIKKVIEIKGSKFTQEDLKKQLGVLKETGYLS